MLGNLSVICRARKRLTFDRQPSPHSAALPTHFDFKVMSSPIADDISARLPASSQVMILLGKTFLHSEPRLTALRRPLSLRFRQVHSPLLRSYVLPATRDPRLYPTADNDHDVHKYVCVLHLTQLHAFRPLSDRSLDRNYHVVPISDAFPWMHRSMYVSTRMPSIIPTVPSCTRL